MSRNTEALNRQRQMEMRSKEYEKEEKSKKRRAVLKKMIEKYKAMGGGS